MSILGISEKPLSSPAYPFGSIGTMKGRDRDFIVTVITDFAELVAEIVKFVRNLFVPATATTWSETTEIEPLLVTETKEIAPAPVVTDRVKINKRGEQIEATFSKIIRFMGGTVTYTRQKGGIDKVSFPHSGTGTLNGISRWKITESWLNGSTLSIPKNLHVKVDYATGKITPSGRGIMAQTAFGTYSLVGIRVQTNGYVVFEYVAPSENKDFGDVTIKKIVVEEERVGEIFSKITWEPSVEDASEVDEAESMDFNKGPPEVETTVAAKTSAIAQADETGELVTTSLLNRVTTFAGENSQAIIGTVSTVAILGAHFLGFI